MSKRGGDSTRVRATKVKKRRGVGSRTIAILDSDEEDLPPTPGDEYARVTKTRVGTSGKAERVSTINIPFFEQQSDGPTPLEETVDSHVDDNIEKIDPVVSVRRRKKKNDSVSHPIIPVSLLN